VYEFLRFTRGDSQFELGKHVAWMHRFTSKAGFGFDLDNTIGATHQSNRLASSWVDFWVEHRLRPMLKLTDDAGLSESDTESLVAKREQYNTNSMIYRLPTVSLQPWGLYPRLRIRDTSRSRRWGRESKSASRILSFPKTSAIVLVGSSSQASNNDIKCRQVLAPRTPRDFPNPPNRGSA
jgi:Fructosamine kinase